MDFKGFFSSCERYKKKSLLGVTAVLQNTTVARKADNTVVSSLRYGRG